MSEAKTKQLDHWLTGFYLSKEAEGCSPKTIKDYTFSLAHFGRFCAGRDPTGIQTNEIKAFIARLRGEPNGHGGHLAAKTIYNVWAALKSFYRWLADETKGSNPMIGVPPQRPRCR